MCTMVHKTGVDMTDIVESVLEEFFAPSSSDLVDHLVGEYNRELELLREAREFVDGGCGSVIHYFFDGNPDMYRVYAREVNDIFNLDAAVKALDSHYWKRALDGTDIYECMPQKRKDEWNEQIRKHDTPTFEETSVRATLEDLLLARKQFLAEKVDGVFKRLSGEHVTNAPEGFYKRMIMGYVFTEWALANHSSSGYIHDLRDVIAKFMGRDLPAHQDTHVALNRCRENSGEWMSMDGGAWRIKGYKVGTCHIEIHPDMAWKLNCVLHYLYPHAIPPNKRKRPVKKSSMPPVHNNPLPFVVLRALDGCSVQKAGDQWSVFLPFTERNNAVEKSVTTILTALGGVKSDRRTFMFDYNPKSVIGEIHSSGVIPDKTSHQFYPTPDDVASYAVECADIQGGHKCLEPSAGTGSLARLMGFGVDCVEISAAYCKVLESLELDGAAIHNTDFLEWNPSSKWDRIVMNPPYSQGRALAHLEKALSLLADGGRLVAILPSSFKRRDLPGAGEWGKTFDGAFQGTSISVSTYIVQM